MAKPNIESREGRPNQFQISSITLQISHIYRQEDPYQIRNKNENITRNNMTNIEEDHFNELLLTLLNGMQDLQKQSLNMPQNMTHRHEYDNLRRDIPIYDWKNMELAGWLLQIEKVGFVDTQLGIWTAHSQINEYTLKMLKQLGHDLDWQDIKRS